jgi:peptide/nickel transport system ATP-binding protein
MTAISPAAPDAATSAPLLAVQDLVKTFEIRGQGVFRRPVAQIQAVAGVSFELLSGEVLAMVGESGCGKSTTGRCILRLEEPTSGSVRFKGDEVLTKSSSEMRALRRRLQIVLQDPYASLHPRRKVVDTVAEPMIIQGMPKRQAHARVPELLELVRLRAQDAQRYPFQFSGGQRQRIGIARALSVEPEVLVLDEPVSALDVSIQASILKLLRELQERLQIAYLFIAHDLAVVRQIAHRVAVMYLGVIVEIGAADDVFSAPTHPYTQALLSAAPVANPEQQRNRPRIVLTGDVPNPAAPPSGCRFRTRCWKAQDICATEQPALIDRGQGHPVACHFA